MKNVNRTPWWTRTMTCDAWRDQFSYMFIYIWGKRKREEKKFPSNWKFFLYIFLEAIHTMWMDCNSELFMWGSLGGKKKEKWNHICIFLFTPLSFRWLGKCLMQNCHTSIHTHTPDVIACHVLLFSLICYTPWISPYVLSYSFLARISFF